MGHIRNRMDSFLAFHSVIPRIEDDGSQSVCMIARQKDGSHNVQVSKNITREAQEIWVGRVDKHTFKVDLMYFKHRIGILLARLQELHAYKSIVNKAQKGKEIDYDCLNMSWELHSQNPVSRNIENLFDALWYGRSDQYEEYDEDYSVYGTREEDYHNDVVEVDSDETEFGSYDHYTMYPGNYTEIKPKQKKKKEVRIDIYKLCLADIKKEEKTLQVVKTLQQDRDHYCLYTICTHINQKTSNDWGILSLILDFL